MFRRRLKEIAGLLRAIQESLRDHVATIKEASASSQRAEDEQRPWWIAQFRIAENQAKESSASRHDNHRQQQILNVLTFLAVLGAWIYAGIAAYQAHLIHNQLTQMEGASRQTDTLLGLYQQQLMQMTKQANDTHDLAVAAEEQAANTAKQLEASKQVTESERATIVVYPHSMDTPITFHGQSLSVSLTLDLFNTGGFPATDVTLRYAVVFPNWGNRLFTLARERQDALCNPSPKPGGAAHEIGAGRPETFQWINGGFGIPDDGLSPWPPSSEKPQEKAIFPTIVGCFDYHSGAMPEWHQSRFAFLMNKKDQSPIIFGIDTPSAQVVLTPDQFAQSKSH
jgi:hypothetical protein